MWNATRPGNDSINHAEIERDGKRAVLEQIQFARNERTGKPTRKLIECFDNGQHCYYDRNVYLIVTAICIDDVRMIM